LKPLSTIVQTPAGITQSKSTSKSDQPSSTSVSGSAKTTAPAGSLTGTTWGLIGAAIAVGVALLIIATCLLCAYCGLIAIGGRRRTVDDDRTENTSGQYNAGFAGAPPGFPGIAMQLPRQPPLYRRMFNPTQSRYPFWEREN
jgi:hypothetical protein